jgi:hypothetical protein
MNDQPQHPHHSSDSYMDAAPVQSFVSPPREVTAEDLARPRYGRPVRNVTPKPDDRSPGQDPAATVPVAG